MIIKVLGIKVHSPSSAGGVNGYLSFVSGQ